MRDSSMDTPPAFQFYAGDWLSSTLGMAWDVKGLYIDLLAWSWKNGPLPDNARWRQRIIGGDAKTAELLWSDLRSRWWKTADGWINPRLERQREIQRSFVERGSRGGSKTQALARRQLASKPPSKGQAKVRNLLDVSLQAKAKPSSSSSSSSSDQDQPAAPRPVSVPFKVYVAIAAQAIAYEPTDDLGAIAEGFKTACARQHLPYDVTLTQKAIDAARVARARTRA